MAQPIECVLGENCYIQNYVDHDDSASASDFSCSSLTYDGHKGTDFGLISLAALADNVQVLVAAPGTVIGVRDNMIDALQVGDDAPDVEGRECGNGVVIRHGDGWETQYCHLAQGSVLVENGQKVATGTPLGVVGLSGNTEFPHLHLSVRQDGNVVDPFDPDGAISCNAPDPAPLWQDEMPGPVGGILNLGFANHVPAFSDIKAGVAGLEVLEVGAPALVVWGFIFGGRAGDEIRLNVTGPSGFEVDHSEILERDRAVLFRAVGKRLTLAGWPLGTYQGIVAFYRDGVLLDRAETEISVAE